MRQNGCNMVASGAQSAPLSSRVTTLTYFLKLLEIDTSLIQVMTTKAVYSKVYENGPTDGKQAMLMIAI